MNLVIDIGNTRTKAGMFHNNELEWTKSVQSLESHEWEVLFQRPDIEHAIVSASGRMNEKIMGLLDNAPFSVSQLNHQSKFPFDIDYETPQTLGLDRLANVAGAHFFFPESTSLIIDTGTCITYDILEKGDVYRGGIISPGLEMRRKSMHEFTANLPYVEGVPEEIVGRSTNDCMLSGSYFGLIAEIEGIINSLKQRFTNVQTIITGGDHIALQKHLESGIFARPYLQLDGLNKLLNYQLGRI